MVNKMYDLTLNLLTTTIVAPPSNASKWQMGFNSAFKGLMAVNSLYQSTPLQTRNAYSVKLAQFSYHASPFPEQFTSVR